MFSLICVWINDSVNNHEAGDLRRYRAHCDVIVMKIYGSIIFVSAPVPPGAVHQPIMIPQQPGYVANDSPPPSYETMKC